MIASCCSGECSFYFWGETGSAKEQWFTALQSACSGGGSVGAIQELYRRFSLRCHMKGQAPFPCIGQGDLPDSKAKGSRSKGRSRAKPNSRSGWLRPWRRGGNEKYARSKGETGGKVSKAGRGVEVKTLVASPEEMERIWMEGSKALSPDEQPGAPKDGLAGLEVAGKDGCSHGGSLGTNQGQPSNGSASVSVELEECGRPASTSSQQDGLEDVQDQPDWQAQGGMWGTPAVVVFESQCLQERNHGVHWTPTSSERQKHDPVPPCGDLGLLKIRGRKGCIPPEGSHMWRIPPVQGELFDM